MARFHVYKIENVTNGNSYIGITGRDVQTRWREHVRRSHTRADRGRFGRAIRKYGPEGFRASTLVICGDASYAKDVEVALIKSMRPGYNSTAGGDGVSGHVKTAAFRARMVEVHGGNTYNLGRRWTPEQRRAMSVRKKGVPNPLPPDFIEAITERLAAINQRRRMPVVCVDTGERFEDAKSAAEHFGFSPSGIQRVCAGQRAMIFGLQFRYDAA